MNSKIPVFQLKGINLLSLVFSKKAPNFSMVLQGEYAFEIVRFSVLFTTEIIIIKFESQLKLTNALA